MQWNLHARREDSSTDVAGYKLLNFFDGCVCDQSAVGVRVSGDQKRNLLLHLKAIEQDNFLGGCTQQITCFESQTEGRTGNFSNEELALLEPSHVAPIHLLGANQSVRFPGVFADQVPSQHFVSHFLQLKHDLARDLDTRPDARHSESEIDLHARKLLYWRVTFQHIFNELVSERKS